MADIHGYKITWQKLEEDIDNFVKSKGRKEIIKEKINTVIPFKRGGSLFSQILLYNLQDKYPEWDPIIRDIPRLITKRKKSAEFLNRFLTNSNELGDIPCIKKDLTSLSEECKELNILLVDDNITTAKRVQLFSKLIKLWLGNNINVKRLAYCKAPQVPIPKTDEYLYINEDIPPHFDYVMMPWKKEGQMERIHRKENPLLRWKVPTDFELDEMLDDFKHYESEIYKNPPYSSIDTPLGLIFRVEYKNMGKKNMEVPTIILKSGSLRYGIKKLNKTLELHICSSFLIIPHPCTDKERLIDERYRICNYEACSFEDSMCYECHLFYVSRDILYYVLKSIEKNGINPIDVSLDFKSHTDCHFKTYMNELIEDDREHFIRFMSGGGS